LVNRKIFKGNVLNNIFLLDSEEETESDDQETDAQRLRSDKSGYDLMNSYSSNSYKTSNGYKSPTPVDPFARSLNTNGHHHYRKLSPAKK